MMGEKKKLRVFFTNIRNDICNKQAKDESIADRLFNYKKIKMANTVLIYASIGSEIVTYGIIKKLLDLEKNVALPKCHDNSIMTFHIINSLSDLENGSFRIPEPMKDTPVPVITDGTICIVPGLAFTENGCRLGYGGGFYDRFIAQHPDLYTIGLAYEELITDKLPVMQHDFQVDAIVTEERMVLCRAK